MTFFLTTEQTDLILGCLNYVRATMNNRIAAVDDIDKLSHAYCVTRITEILEAMEAKDEK